MEKANLYKTLRGHTSGWVSISKDQKRVIASARTVKSLLKKLADKGNPDGYIMKAAKDYSHYVG